MREIDVKVKKNKHLILVAAIIAIVMIASVWLLTVRMRKSVDESIYADRKELLGRITETCASVLNDNIQYGQSLVDIFSDEALHDLGYYENSDLSTYIRDLSGRSSYQNLKFFFVDSNGKYYSSDGVFGKIVDTNYYTDDSADRLSYISSLPHMDADTSYLIFRNRFAKELQVNTDQGTVTLLYSGILYDIAGLNETISKEFSGANNTFIYNNTNGVMLYKEFGIRLLIDGYNIYPKFEQGRILYGEEAEDQVQGCRNRETVVVCMEIDGDEYYFCSAPMEFNDWSVAFIVQSKYLDEVSGNSFSQIVLYISLIAVVLAVSVLYLVLATYKHSVTQKSLEKIQELNVELVNATNAKSEFLSNMSHDIRTPINGIMGMTTIAKNVEGNPKKTVECLDKIQGASSHLLSLINDVLDMTRIERGKTEIASRPIDIRMVFDNCASIIRGQMTGRSLELITEVDCTHTRILGDDLHLRQIFINILGNAVKFTKDGGTIWFRCRELSAEDGNVVLAFEVEDTGIGMKPEFLEKIFDAFTQDDAGARSDYKGTGLGMAITKQLTELMKGTISVESEYGKGSRFTVTIPFRINTAEPEKKVIADMPSDISGIRLLLAEDNELNTEIAVELLTDAGAIVTTVENGQLALEAFTNNPAGTFDAILMDIMMPVMNGIEATKAIRAFGREDARSIPILAMTANAFESDIQATHAAGMNAHLIKPININEVVKTISYFTRKQ